MAQIEGQARDSDPDPPLTGERLGPDPLKAIQVWLREARERSRMAYPEAACLSTVDARGWPEGRVILLKGVDSDGLTFYSNYRSAKGRALADTPVAALTFYWDSMARQIRVRGSVARVTESESNAYFRSRPRGSQVGAWASEQSEPIESWEILEARAKEVDLRFSGREVSRPSHWGGYRLKPVEIEFWKGRVGRLHDRIRFRRLDVDQVDWAVERLSP